MAESKTKILIDLAELSKFRNGSITFTKKSGENKMKLPACCLSTNAGCIPHLTAETLSYVSKSLLPDMVQIPISSVVDHKETISAYPGSSSEFMCLPRSSLMLVTSRDSLTKSKKTPTSRYTTNKTISIWGNNGRVGLNVEKYMNLMETLSPDLYEAMADGDTMMENVSKKRISKSFTNSLIFLEESLKFHKESKCLENSQILVVLEGGGKIELRKRFSSEALKRIEDSGASDICGGFLIDAIPCDRPLTSEILDLVKAATQDLPKDKLRFIRGARTPLDVLALVESGIDIFDTSYPCNAAHSNKALVFHIEDFESLSQNMKDNFYVEEERNPSVTNCDVTNKLDSSTMFEEDMSDARYRDSFEPLVKDCTCYTCKRHTKAYIHHLVSTREMLAPILLTLHNLHHYLRFFEILRYAMENDCFEKLKSWLQS